MYSCLCVILNFCGISLMKSRFVSSSSQIKQFIFKSGTSYFFFIYYLFYCCSSTIVSIFTPPHPPPHPSPPPTSNLTPLALSMCPLYMFLDGPSPISPDYSSPSSPLVTVNLFFISFLKTE